MAGQQRTTTTAFPQESQAAIARVALYARVSTLNNQDPDMQLTELREQFGIGIQACEPCPCSLALVPVVTEPGQRVITRFNVNYAPGFPVSELPTTRPGPHLSLPTAPFVVRNLSQMPRRQLDIHWLLLNLHSGVGSELLLAFDASLTHRSELRRVPDFVE